MSNKSFVIKGALAAVVLLVGTVGCAKKKPDPMGSVSGVIVKPDYVALSPAAYAHVRLADVTDGHIESETIVEKKVRPDEDGTIPFTLTFKEKRINQGRRYAVDARVVDRDRVMVIGGKQHPVLTKGHGDTVEMQLDRGAKFSSL